MDAFIAKRIWRTRQSGMSLIELMIAMTVLVVGMLALMTLVTTAISSNNRNKLDTTGTMLAQTVLEGIAAQPASAGATFTMSDCNPAGSTTWTIATAGGSAIGAALGADVIASTGNIDFNSQSYSAVTANYKMKYVTCGVSGAQATYDVRWNVRTLTAFTKLVTVSARQLGVSTTGANLPFFSPPITLRTIAGQ
ncbi:MAG TPA: prepilin-type N-terminal cleavage/methylation domain-containing protein [Terriglobales bacterium]